jgi:hypothetical protein
MLTLMVADGMRKVYRARDAPMNRCVDDLYIAGGFK